MLLAASLLVTDGKLPVKVALSKAGFTSEEIAKEKKQRQARRRRDFLLRKNVTTKRKGRRTMSTSTLPPRTANVNTDQDETKSINVNRHNEDSQKSHDTSRLDALIFACSMQKPISLPHQLSSSPPSRLSAIQKTSTNSSSPLISTSSTASNHAFTSI
jgi:hypothetical protein